MNSKWLEKLNPAQRQAVTHTDGPLLIIAGAGTGKTRTLACRVAYLVAQGVAPERILLLTFTRRAAAEMINRAEELVEAERGGVAGRIWGGTFHAVANRLLRVYGQSIGLDEGFTVMDSSDAADMFQIVRTELGVAKGDRRFPRKQTLAAIYSRTVNAAEKLDAALKANFPWCLQDADAIRDIFRAYVQRKRARSLLDYDDLLLYWKAMVESEELREAIAGRFDHVLVDEYQDTNIIQADILRGLRRDHPNICVVGDDAQSIYSFRAATIRNILDFGQHFPGAQVVTLERNYRSTQPILSASNAIMATARERYTKELYSTRESAQKPRLITCRDEDNQAQAVCQRVLEHHEAGIPLMGQAVLFRAGNHSAALEIELSRRNIPFRKYGGLKYVEAAHIKDLLALLRILENPFDEMSWMRALQMLEGVGPRIAQRLMDALGVRTGSGAGAPDATSEAAPGDTPNAAPGDTADMEQPAVAAAAAAAAAATDVADAALSPLMRFLAEPPPPPPAARDAYDRMRVALGECEGHRFDEDLRLVSDGPPPEPPTPSAQVERLCTYYEPICERIHDRAAVRMRDVEQLAQIAAGYQTRGRFVADLTLDPPDGSSDYAGRPHLDEDYLTLSTIHSAKGCEWDAVHVIHAADGMIPSDMALNDKEGEEEERRLFYVALTRAKDHLYVYFPLRYYVRRGGMTDRHNFAKLTRFLPPKLVNECFEPQSAYRDPERDAPAKIDPTDAITRWLDDLW